jgi:hypothetical protein
MMQKKSDVIYLTVTVTVPTPDRAKKLLKVSEKLYFPAWRSEFGTVLMGEG